MIYQLRQKLFYASVFVFLCALFCFVLLFFFRLILFGIGFRFFCFVLLCLCVCVCVSSSVGISNDIGKVLLNYISKHSAAQRQQYDYLGTNNVHGQISVHIFKPIGGYGL